MGADMKRIIPVLAAGAFLALGATGAFAQMSGGISGTGGAKEQMLPSTVGIDPRPDRETLRARRPMFDAIEARPVAQARYRGHGHWRMRHHRHWR